ncbi:hypothetical protein DUI87_24601 [Hirundo rustica rustica]|uniref:Uncharacterized protein n=1 Tax=Hirundo rustica rustica TaxID=333673 RepID=A0A3M0JDJ9_HIRRU|nr:hypothetical protein DUI87_24601 [Hirundo rustica rustica]
MGTGLRNRGAKGSHTALTELGVKMRGSPVDLAGEALQKHHQRCLPLTLASCSGSLTSPRSMERLPKHLRGRQQQINSL